MRIIIGKYGPSNLNKAEVARLPAFFNTLPVAFPAGFRVFCADWSVSWSMSLRLILSPPKTKKARFPGLMHIY